MSAAILAILAPMLIDLANEYDPKILSASAEVVLSLLRKLAAMGAPPDLPAKALLLARDIQRMHGPGGTGTYATDAQNLETFLGALQWWSLTDGIPLDDSTALRLARVAGPWWFE